MLRAEWFYDKNRLLSRLTQKTVYHEGHWLWRGKITKHGRGVIIVGGRKGKDIEIHRVSAYIHHGLNLKDSNQHALHKPDCPYVNCWNPDHLYVGTHQDNMKDMMKTPTFRCGHPRSADNKKILANGRTRCKLCHNTLNRNRRNKLTRTNA